MQCQMPGCKNKGIIKKTTGDGIFCGIHLEEVSIYTCGKHNKKEIETELSKIGEGLVLEIQQEQFNPFKMALKQSKK